MNYVLILVLLSVSYSLATISKQKINSSITTCPEWYLTQFKNQQKCASTGLVPENFNTGAVIISDNEVSGSIDKGSNFATSIVTRIINTWKSDRTNGIIPLLILPVRAETIKKIASVIEKDRDMSSEERSKWKSALVQIGNANSYQWQQDYMQPYVNPKTGTTEIRPVKNYGIDRGDNWVDSLPQQITSNPVIAACGIKLGEPINELNNPDKDIVSGSYGGNIEGYPGGLCLLGDDSFLDNKESTSWQKYAKEICPTANQNDPTDKVIKVPTSWLRVGHADEIMKVVKDPQNKAPCDYAVVVASPAKAIELLNQKPDEEFINFSNKGIDKENLSKMKNWEGFLYICRAINFSKDHVNPNNTDSPRNKVKGTHFFKKIIDTIINTSYAQAVLLDGPPPSYCDIGKVKNADVAKIFKDPNNPLGIYNDLVAQKIKGLIVELKARNEAIGCKDTKILELPDLFYSDVDPIKKADNTYELPLGTGLSLFPNPTNSISVNNSVITPQQFNKSFEKSITDSYKEIHLGVEFVDSFESAHMKNGNLHCSTNTIHFCGKGN
jgi:hypothetical protein